MDVRNATLVCWMLFGLCHSCFVGRAQDGLVISEFMAINSDTIRDDFGDSSDYVEIYNGTADAINLDGYYLTDSLSRKTQWQFPSIRIDSGSYLLVWASGRDRRAAGEPLHANFKLDGAGEALALVLPDQTTVVHQYVFGAQALDRAYGLEAELLDSVTVVANGASSRFLAPASDALGKLWTLPAFDDQGWALGKSGFGFDTNAPSLFSPWIATDVKDLLVGASPPRGGLFIRIPFVVERPSEIANLTLQARYDDGFVAYLNGTEVARRGIPANAIPSFSSTSSLARSNDVAILPEQFSSLALSQGLRAGTNVLAIHAINHAASDGDFLIVPELLSRRLRYRTNAERFLASPSPGFANAIGFPALSSALEFSVRSRTFVESFELAVSPSRAGAQGEIRYTLDGSTPGPDSLLYTGPLQIANSMEIRARLFQPGLLPGPVHTEAYARLAPEMLTVSSDLPLILVHSYGVGAFTESKSKGCVLFVHEPKRGRASFTNAPNLVFRAGLKLRGSSSVGNPKYNWAVDSWDEDDRDQSLTLLGLPTGAEWVFHAPYMTDTTLIANPLASAMSLASGRWAPHYRSVELYLNQRPSGQASATVAPTNYFGVYNILQRIGIGPNRVEIDELTDQDTQPPEVTGGYLLVIDRNIDGPPPFSAGGLDINYEKPSHDEMTSAQREAQRAYLTNYLNSFAAVLNGPNWTNSVTGYAPYVDTGSWIDFHLVNTISVNGEVPGNSTFFHKPRGGPLTFGPIWDFDKAFSWTGARDDAPLFWEAGRGSFGATWWGRLFQDINFWQAYIDRFQELDAGPYGVPGLWELIDRLNDEVRESAVRDMARWKQPKRGGSQEGEIAYLKDWLARRIHFMETNFLGRPDILERAGQLNPGDTVAISAPPGATIYYTLDGTDPRAVDGGIAVNALAYTAPIPMSGEARLVARALDLKHRNLTGSGNPPLSSPWSGPARSHYTKDAPAGAGDLAVTELNYHPSPPTAQELSAQPGLAAGDFEFIEIQNIGGRAVDLFDSRFTRGVQFSFANATIHALAPGARLLLVKNSAAMMVRYGALPNIAGSYGGSLANQGQTLRLEDSSGVPLIEVAYESRWYPLTGGLGFTLVRRDFSAEADGRNAWGSSDAPLGSPGRQNPSPADLPSVVINEILANSERPLVDTIELLNLGSFPADISGWFLTDDPAHPRKYRIPENTILLPGGFWVTSEAEFGSPLQGANAFQLGSRGDQVWLFAADQSGYLFSHGFEFGPSEVNTSLGRRVTRDGEEQLVAQRSRTFGSANSGPMIGPVIFREIMYHPPDLFENGAFWDNEEDEYIEIQNAGNNAVLLADAVSGETWRLRGSVDFDFPKQFVLQPNQSALLVGFDPGKEPGRAAAWLQEWALDAAFPLLGPWRGKLENSGAEVHLLKPGPVNPQNGETAYVVVDRVAYGDRAPWPAAADGAGGSLERREAGILGNEAANWMAALPSPGRRPGAGSLSTIIGQPLGLTVVAGARAAFDARVVASSTARLQWRHDGANIPGATNSELALAQVRMADAGRYSLVVVDENGSTESNPAILQTLRPATIVRHPEGRNLKPGSTATFSVAAMGRGTLSYQWHRDGVPIPGATGSTLSLANVQSAATGAYTVEVTDSVGSSVSKPAILNVLVRPSFALQPQSLVAIVGDAVEFRAEVTGLAPFGYRWRKGGATLPGATNPILKLANVQLSDAGTYSVLVTNLTSGVLGTNSQPATLIVMNDADRDRVGDEWETQFGYSPSSAADAGLDDDGDGQTTLQEFIAGTDPRDPKSHLRIDSVRLTTQGVEVSFTARANRGYTVQFRESVEHGLWQTLRQVNGRGAPSQETVVDPLPLIRERLYRIVTPQQFPP